MMVAIASGGRLRQEQNPHSTLLAMSTAASYEGLHQAQSPVLYQDLHSIITLKSVALIPYSLELFKRAIRFSPNGVAFFNENINNIKRL
ncbi:MAG: hypothetical protein HWQ43_09455 [Nostoc sp. JL31]|uniref:hypothetical protein n=1 Tax=Nostoc sp. JL31 TaxID=2815395 RepID=UPI0025DFA346|nr:hypothetical protein [Nostoc sp. JL31]MBN3889384.1 hypothetical protein [Nostoc sp. JL31]